MAEISRAGTETTVLLLKSAICKKTSHDRDLKDRVERQRPDRVHHHPPGASD